MPLVTVYPVDTYAVQRRLHLGRTRRIGSVLLLWLGVFGLMATLSAHAAIETRQFESPQQQAQYQALIEELRCPKCQNQNLAGSDAPIARDMKQKTYEMVRAGQTDQQIRSYMVDRYGDFISYRPPVRPSTWVLWFLPPIVLVVVLASWFYWVRRQQLRRPMAAAALTPEEQQRLEALLTGTSTSALEKATDQAIDQVRKNAS